MKIIISWSPTVKCIKTVHVLVVYQNQFVSHDIIQHLNVSTFLLHGDSPEGLPHFSAV